MKTNIVIRNSDNDKIICRSKAHGKENIHNSVAELVECTFKPHLDKMSVDDRASFSEVLIKRITGELNKYGDCHLEYPGDLSRGIIDKSTLKLPHIMHRVQTFA